MQILGCQGPYPGPGGATSGYLLTGTGRPVLLELGSGILARMSRQETADLGAVVLSHLHFDHCAEVPLLGYLREAGRRAGEDLPPLPVYLPAESAGIRQSWPGGGIFDFRFLDETPFTVEGLTFQGRPTRHSVPTWGFRIVGEGQLGYTADTGPDPELARFFSGVDLLLAEAGYGDGPSGPAHLTTIEAAELALQAGAGGLLLTHLPPEAPDPTAPARAMFPLAEWAGSRLNQVIGVC